MRPEGHHSVPNVLNIFNTEPYDKGVVRESRLFLWKGGAEMRSVKYMDEEIVIRKAMEVLIKELGPVEAIRFIYSVVALNSSLELIKTWPIEL